MAEQRMMAEQRDDDTAGVDSRARNSVIFLRAGDDDRAVDDDRAEGR